ncbi:quinoprotein relay system zinc metallohydrolase 2 [Methylobacterium sp. E-041]|uniref:quinoprotein relay system zinc metallohydrolase 2 n=1 Tax=unclassified Methylobacterium TaxID=2615210 RepID=UPI0011CA9E2A|nr:MULTISPECIES: quinoprotein relay system zinc metallohydrolase 2 [unclassified Methylobacterium]MCJ2039493.1 quinoprotein relay system zinc metallohydrolase 2 [Methylobacterium sp. J-059]MCJ2076944.1 quinoprotein relay system zinc metallohydrolase 2 [Methylobacterium sp. E-016]MCJ2108977.1 quinoprotein relay system zinc metallohydrolase 2 [Methylobacterium sp. E-041]TXM92109.1 quinoprotein relay system zinc metallohydrolase 2 [Methylobacterium sp. WL116]TXN71940.1 quinoprotein relay system z
MSAVLTRRAALFGGFCLCCLPKPGFSAESFAMEEVGPGIFMRRGPNADATPENDDAIANIGFIVGKEAVLVTESGGSLADGQWLRSEIVKRTSKPIRHVVITHVHPDHCFGAAAFLADKPNVIGHARLREALDARGDYYRQRLVDILGADKAGSVVYPTQEVKDGAEVDLGDRTLRFAAHATAHTSCDLSMIDSASGLLFTGDLLSVGRIPSLDGNLNGWLKEIEGLRGSGATRAVPGHGPVSVALAPGLDALAGYLTTLRDETRKAIAADVSIEKAVGTVAQSERGKWDLFDSYNGRNVTEAYKELEWE